MGRLYRASCMLHSDRFLGPRDGSVYDLRMPPPHPGPHPPHHRPRPHGVPTHSWYGWRHRYPPSIYAPVYDVIPVVWDAWWLDPQRHMRWAWDVVCNASSETRRGMIRDTFPTISDENLDRASEHLDRVCAARTRSAITYGPSGQVISITPPPSAVPWGWLAGGAAAGLVVGWVARGILG